MNGWYDLIGNYYWFSWAMSVKSDNLHSFKLDWIKETTVEISSKFVEHVQDRSVSTLIYVIEFSFIDSQNGWNAIAFEGITSNKAV